MQSLTLIMGLLTLTLTTSGPSIELHRGDGGQPADRFEVVGLEKDDLARLQSAGVELKVFVIHDSVAEKVALFGEQAIAQDRLVFVPRFPLQPGLKYRAVLSTPTTTDRPRVEIGDGVTQYGYPGHLG